jgi:hypothetical protein
MSTHATEPSKDSSPSNAQESTSCGTNTCSSGICSPCLVIWGLVALYFVLSTLLEYFQ